jgi:hypothetical protein
VPAGLATAVLYGKPRKKDAGFDPWQATLILDVSDLENFPYAVADPPVASQLSVALFSWTAVATDSSVDPGSVTCALTGAVDKPFMGKYPNPPCHIWVGRI